MRDLHGEYKIVLEVDGMALVNRYCCKCGQQLRISEDSGTLCEYCKDLKDGESPDPRVLRGYKRSVQSPVCEVFEPDLEVNARLIAAAPAMLGVLEIIQECFAGTRELSPQGQCNIIADAIALAKDKA